MSAEDRMQAAFTAIESTGIQNHEDLVRSQIVAKIVAGLTKVQTFIEHINAQQDTDRKLGRDALVEADRSFAGAVKSSDQCLDNVRNLRDQLHNLVDRDIPNEIKLAESRISSAEETQRDAKDRQEEARRKISAGGLPQHILEKYETLLRQSTDREANAKTEAEQSRSSIPNLKFLQNRAAKLKSDLAAAPAEEEGEEEDSEYREILRRRKAREEEEERQLREELGDDFVSPDEFHRGESGVIAEPSAKYETEVNNLKAIATRLKKLSDELASHATQDEAASLSKVEEMCVQASGVSYQEAQDAVQKLRGVIAAAKT